MNEYLLLIRTEGDYCAEMPAEQYKAHLQKVGNYIQKLTSEGRFRGAQPLHLDGMMLQGNKGVFKDGPFIESKEVIIGYFLILAKDLQEAREIAKANPVFEETNARIEIRLIKHEEGIN
ncbi:MAG: YciI family protein [Bacteroidota bacterium]|nr:YciI family protein [Bacteroidota bacterium]